MDRLEVEYYRGCSTLAIGVLGLLLVPMGLQLLYRGLSGGEGVAAALGGALLAGFVALVWFLRRLRSSQAASLTREGVMLKDGRALPWTDLERVVDVWLVRRGERVGQFQLRLAFGRGDVVSLSRDSIRNFQEVHDFVTRVPDFLGRTLVREEQEQYKRR